MGYRYAKRPNQPNSGHRLWVMDEEPEHFGEDALPRPPGLQRIFKSQRSSNSTANRMVFVQELQSVVGESVSAKTVVFLEQMINKKGSRECQLADLVNEGRETPGQIEFDARSLPICDELHRTVNTADWEPQFIYYCERSKLDDIGLARQINALCDTLTTVINGRWPFITELEVLSYKFVPGKMVEFMKEIQDKDVLNLMKLQILGREFQLRDHCWSKRVLYADVPRCLSNSSLFSAVPITLQQTPMKAFLMFDVVTLGFAGVKKFIGAVAVLYVIYPLNLYLVLVVGRDPSNCNLLRKLLLLASLVARDVVPIFVHVNASNGSFNRKSYALWQINALCDTLTTVINGRWPFITELEVLSYKFVPGKMVEFMKEIQDKDVLNLMKLQILGREFQLRDREKDLFIQKLKGNMDY
nr:hypothetical protein [Tanacetum cinerariifolium]